MSNILKAFLNIVDNYNTTITNVTDGNNRANNMGEGLESYIKKAFAGNFTVSDAATVERNLRDTFSYIGTKNSPPDIILSGSDAIEVKKTETIGALQLNSSQPKAKLTRDNPRINESCRNCENGEWNEKDIIYAMGHILKGTRQLKSLWFVYGTCYAANEEVYHSVETGVRDLLIGNDSLDISLDTNELGRVNNIDSLNITYLRIRGMWVIKHPSKVFESLYEQRNESFSLVGIIPLEKYNSFPINDRNLLESSDTISVSDEVISDPNNAANEMRIKFLLFRVSQ
ncbi:MAG: NgoPII family restriction endonuclease [Campylobacterales bacterium]|nr:NgoPII family restriction endonuclease [Campylobacterales bacterium]